MTKAIRPAARLALALGLLGIVALPALAQTALAPQETNPLVDGVVVPGEYAWTKTIKDVSLSVALSADRSTLYLAFTAPTTGWLANGLGSLKMNKAFMVMGFDKGGSKISQQLGAGHGHSDAKDKLLQEGVAKLVEKTTTLEYSVPAAGFIQGDKLDLIMAYGTQPNFAFPHKWRDALSIAITAP